jgi:hypothetical protein
MNRAGLRRDIPAGSLDKSIKFHSSSTALWDKGDIDLSSVDWSRKAWIFAEAAEDRADDAATHSMG